MPLTDLAVRKAKPADRPYKLSDGKGLCLLVSAAGKYWRFNYRFGGKRKTLALGVFDDVGIKDARERLEQSRRLLAQGIDPSLHKQLSKQAVSGTASDSFEAVAREWYAKYSPSWVPTHATRILRRLERDVFPWLGGTRISAIKAADVLRVLQRIEKRGAIETAHRANQNCGQVFRYAVATGRAERDPTPDLRGALGPVVARHHPSITDPKKIGQLLVNIDAYSGGFVTRCALIIAPLVFVRPGELRRAEWSEFDLDESEWRIPAARMKMNAMHIVPLARQAVDTLRELHALTGSGTYVFPGARSAARPMSENTVNAALRSLGYATDELTGHGFRSMASTLLNEQGWTPDAIERQLAHSERNGVRAAYNRAEHLPERRKMMQAWADYLDSLRSAALST